jgi:hypothetical protein
MYKCPRFRYREWLEITYYIHFFIICKKWRAKNEVCFNIQVVNIYTRL